jgi:hypothetical protein
MNEGFAVLTAGIVKHMKLRSCNSRRTRRGAVSELQGVTTQTTVLFIITAVRTTNPKSISMSSYVIVAYRPVAKR